MKKLKSVVVGVVCFTLMVGAIGLLTSRPAPAAPPGAPVTVINTPLPVQGAVTVSGTVGVSSLPPVTVANTPLPVNVTNALLPVTGTVTANINGTPTTLITNPTTNPVLVSNLNDSVDHEYSGGLCETDNQPVPNAICSGFSIVATNGPETLGEITIPAFTAKGIPVTQAVIEFVSGICVATPSDDIISVSVNIPGPRGIDNFLLPVRTAAPTDASNWTFSQATKIYASPGTTVALLVRSTGAGFTNQQSCSATFSATLLTQ